MASLEIIDGKNAGKRFFLTEAKEMSIGRHPMCDIVLAEGAVSRKHARITRDGDDFLIEDLGSLNGTRINGVLIDKREPLEPQDRIQIQELTLKFHGDDDANLGTSTAFLDAPNSDAKPDPPSAILASVDVGSSIRNRKELNAENKLKAFQEIIINVGNAMATSDVIQRVFESVFRIFPQATCGHVIVREPKGKRLVNHTYVRGRKGEESGANESTDVKRTVSATIAKKVMSEGVAILSADAVNDDRFSASESVAEMRIRSMLCAPLMGSDEKALGMIQVDTQSSGQVFNESDLDMLACVATLVAHAVERSRVHEELLELEFQHQELETARDVQREFLPQHSPDTPGYDFFAFYEPAYHVGGDYYDYVSFPDGRLAMSLGDVSGKGIGAALFTARLCSEVRFSLSNHADLGSAVCALNRSMFGETFQGRFVTFVVGLLDPQTHRLTLVNAGHMPPLLWRAGKVEPIGEGRNGPPLAFDTEWKYEEVSIDLKPGDAVIAYTDGISEAVNSQHTMLGNQGVVDAAQRYSADSKQHIGEFVLDSVREFVGDLEQQDDTCLLAFRRLPRP
ncbi:MAG: SpoIIE family protein phosphatase [Planctomycetota bacterium]|nr:SpoIIE family protein phosphatase [Planctomycetota bacterium]